MSLVRVAPRHLGWDTGRGVVASVRVERLGEEVEIVGLEYDDVAGLRDLLDALLGVTTGAHTVHGTDPVLVDCGFEPDGGRFVRGVEVETAATASVTLAQLEDAVRASWAADTSEGPDEWSPENPAWGQCAVTSLVLRDYLGGDLVVAGVVRDGRRVDRHVWLRLPSGLDVDLTAGQFGGGEEYEPPAPLEETLVPGTDERYALLAARVGERVSAARR